MFPARKRMDLLVSSDTACYRDDLDLGLYKLRPVFRKEALKGDYLLLSKCEITRDSGWVDLHFPAEGAHFRFTLSHPGQNWEVIRVGVTET